jgi:hypothetical protein
VLTLENTVARITRSLTRLRMGLEELSNIDTTPLALGPDLDDQVT